MLLERGARLLVNGVVRRDLGQRDATQLGGKAWTQRDDVHRRVLRRFCVCSTFHQNRCSDKPACPCLRPVRIKDNARGLAYDRMVGERMPTFSTNKARHQRGGRSTMMKERVRFLASLACGTVSVERRRTPSSLSSAGWSI